MAPAPARWLILVLYPVSITVTVAEKLRLPGVSVSATKSTCPYPEVRNASLHHRDNIVDLHRNAADVWFDGALRVRLRKPCKIKCINGEWVGPVCQTVQGDQKYHPIYKSCSTDVFRMNFEVSYKNKTILETEELAHSARVQVRCREFGLYKLIGDSRLSCHNGHWKPRVPSCIPTSLLNNFADDSSPPTIQIKVTSGSVSVEPTGELAVYPGSVLHLECLHARSQGEPEWSWTSTYRTYPTGWSIAADEREWKYRLSIYYVKPQDTGIYTCATPKGLTHSVVVNVQAVHCNSARVSSTDPHLLIHVEGIRLGQHILFSCSLGFKLVGLTNATCQASGIWSGDAPHCLPILCQTLQVPPDSKLKIIRQETQYGGRTVFQCPPGHKLQGSATIFCDQNEQWTGTIPECKEIFCSSPLIPQYGKLEFGNESATSPYVVGSVVTFSCKGVHQLVGERSIVCTDAGYWSNPPPFCRAKCNHPGTVTNGEFFPKKDLFEVGERVSLRCDESFSASSRSRPRCLKTGQWSEVGMECRSNRNKLKLLLAKESPPTTTTIFTGLEKPLDLNGSDGTVTGPARDY